MHSIEIFIHLFQVNVNGNDAIPLYKYLKEKQHGFLGFNGIKWNFTKVSLIQWFELEWLEFECFNLTRKNSFFFTVLGWQKWATRWAICTDHITRKHSSENWWITEAISKNRNHTLISCLATPSSIAKEIEKFAFNL